MSLFFMVHGWILYGQYLYIICVYITHVIHKNNILHIHVDIYKSFLGKHTKVSPPEMSWFRGVKGQIVRGTLTFYSVCFYFFTMWMNDFELLYKTKLWNIQNINFIFIICNIQIHTVMDYILFFKINILKFQPSVSQNILYSEIRYLKRWSS